MAFKYSLVEKRIQPSDPESEKQWYATPQSATPLSGKAMTRAATKNTTTAPVEMEASLDLLGDFVPEQLLQGHTVVIPGLGYFRLSFKSRGSATVEGFDPAEMIYDVRPVFVCSKEFRQRVQQGIEFEDGGVTKDGVSYRSRADYLKVTGQGGTTELGGGTEPGGEDQEEDPLA